MTSSFGARLRQHREERGVPLSIVAAQTKIKLSLLEGLERDDLAHWPPGIFRRAYLRAYAHAIGLNPDTILREFLERYPDPPEIAEPGARSSESNAGAQGGSTMRLRYIVGSAVGTLARLRRGSVVEERVRPQGTTGNIPAPVSMPEPADIPDATADAAGLEADAVNVEADAMSAGADAAKLDGPPPLTPDVPSPAPAPESMQEPVAVQADARPDVDLLAAADLCTALGRVENASQMPALLREAARILDARGLIVWVWDPIAEELQPALVHGYSEKVLAHLPSLRADADNVTAAAFRSAQPLAKNGKGEASGALAVPLLTPGGCAGVLAIELSTGAADTTSVRAVAMFVAAMLAQLVGGGTGASESSQIPDADGADAQIFNAG